MAVCTEVEEEEDEVDDMNVFEGPGYNTQASV